ncbi:MAG: hypothetical protein HYX47_21070 [Burkholderiales bacterium]|nr:hypothetical protein [Burkholderiales bacterium]
MIVNLAPDDAQLTTAIAEKYMRPDGMSDSAWNLRQQELGNRWISGSNVKPGLGENVMVVAHGEDQVVRGKEISTEGGPWIGKRVALNDLTNYQEQPDKLAERGIYDAPHLATFLQKNVLPDNYRGTVYLSACKIFTTQAGQVPQYESAFARKVAAELATKPGLGNVKVRYQTSNAMDRSVNKMPTPANNDVGVWNESNPRESEDEPVADPVADGAPSGIGNPELELPAEESAEGL